MISLQWMFYLMVIFFALVGSIRGWQREVLALTGLIASIAALNQFGFVIVTNIANLTGAADDLMLQQRFFQVQAIFHCTIAFFSYQVVARLADTVSGGKLGERAREGFQRRFIGSIVGAFNGYLLVGGLWSFLEFRLSANGYVPLGVGEPYPFSEQIIIRPELTESVSTTVVQYLPIAVIGPNLWLLFFFVAFFIVIIALV